VARILIVGGGCRGRVLTASLLEDGHRVRITTRSEAGREAIESVGAECWIGTPDRLATLRGALDGVTILCWLLGTATGSAEQLAALHSTRLELFVTQAIDTTVRGLLYECSGTSTPAATLAGGEEIVRRLAARNEIPVAWLREGPERPAAWQQQTRAAIAGLLLGPALASG
jgi:uncharacterized protein YbjT (DUF2867 family)